MFIQISEQIKIKREQYHLIKTKQLRENEFKKKRPIVIFKQQIKSNFNILETNEIEQFDDETQKNQNLDESTWIQEEQENIKQTFKNAQQFGQLISLDECGKIKSSNFDQLLFQVISNIQADKDNLILLDLGLKMIIKIVNKCSIQNQQLILNLIAFEFIPLIRKYYINHIVELIIRISFKISNWNEILAQEIFDFCLFIQFDNLNFEKATELAFTLNENFHLHINDRGIKNLLKDIQDGNFFGYKIINSLFKQGNFSFFLKRLSAFHFETILEDLITNISVKDIKRDLLLQVYLNQIFYFKFLFLIIQTNSSYINKKFIKMILNLVQEETNLSVLQTILEILAIIDSITSEEIIKTLRDSPILKLKQFY